MADIILRAVYEVCQGNTYTIASVVELTGQFGGLELMSLVGRELSDFHAWSDLTGPNSNASSRRKSILSQVRIGRKL